MLATGIVFLGHKVCLVCDGKCDKAWGINTRPKEQLSEDPDDYVFLSDSELFTAPQDPGTYEGEPRSGHDRQVTVCQNCGFINVLIRDFARDQFDLSFQITSRPALDAASIPVRAEENRGKK